MAPREFSDWGSELFREFQQFREQLDEVLSSMLGGDVQLASGTMNPAVDIVESDNHYAIYVEIPGVPKENLRLMAKEGVLFLSGERKAPEFGQNVRKIRSELPYGKFQRTLQLPKDADINRVNARYEDGILWIQIEKKEETKPRRIDVQVK